MNPARGSSTAAVPTLADRRGASREAAEVAFELVKSRLDRQGVRLAEIRTNSNVLLATTALIASFLGKTSIDRNDLSPANWVAVVFLVAGVLLGIRPLWPVRDPSSGSRPKRIVAAIPLAGDWLVKRCSLDSVWRGGLSVDEVLVLGARRDAQTRLAAASRLEHNVELNQTIINRRSRWVIHASLCLVGQVTAWTIGLAT
jgi:hypothetical protein